MYDNIIKSKLGLVSIIVVATLVGINTSKVDEDILKKDISTITILVIEGAIVLTAILSAILFMPKMRTKVIADMKKMNIIDSIKLGGYAIVGLVIAFVANDALIHHGTNEVKIYQLIVGLLITGLIFFLTSNKKVTIKKLLFS
jgi:hypothetical protein